jgi:hypothetical protein
VDVSIEEPMEDPVKDPLSGSLEERDRCGGIVICCSANVVTMELYLELYLERYQQHAWMQILRAQQRIQTGVADQY